MPKTITSPVKRYPGTVTLQDPLEYPQWALLNDANEAAKAYAAEKGDEARLIDFNHLLWPGLVACVEKWDIQGLSTSPEMPVTPTQSARELIAWLRASIFELFNEAEDAPNA